VPRRAGIVILLLALAVAGCGGAKKAADPVAGFDGSAARVNASFRALDQAAFADPKTTRTAAVAHLQDSRPGVRFAAVYSLSLTVREPQPLERVLHSPRPSERMLAARGLVAIGDKQAIPTLIDALNARAPLPFGAPPEPAWRAARFDLLQYVPSAPSLTGAGFTAKDAAAATPLLRRWWRVHAASLRWDPATHSFHT
jgi:hypothetical protein